MLETFDVLLETSSTGVKFKVTSLKLQEENYVPTFPLIPQAPSPWGGPGGGVRPRNNTKKSFRSVIADSPETLVEKKAATYSPALHRSTIGAGGLNFSVRNGKRWNPAAIIT